MKDAMILNRIFVVCVALFIVLFVFYLVLDTTLSIATGKTYTEDLWFAAENNYCQMNGGYTAVQYIAQSCSWAGCHDVQKTKCVKDNQQKIIDYSDDIFCKYTLKGDYGWC